MKMLDGISLHTLLLEYGFTHKKENDDQRRTIYDKYGNRMGSFTEKEGRVWVYSWIEQHSSIVPVRSNKMYLTDSEIEALARQGSLFVVATQITEKGETDLLSVEPYEAIDDDGWVALTKPMTLAEATEIFTQLKLERDKEFMAWLKSLAVEV
jgi:hypothetical protein